MSICYKDNEEKTWTPSVVHWKIPQSVSVEYRKRLYALTLRVTLSPRAFEVVPRCSRQIFQYHRLIKLSSVSERTGGTYPVSSHSNAARDHFTSRDQKLLPHILLYLHKTARKSLHRCASLQNKMFIPPCVSLILRTANKLTRVWEIMQFYSPKYKFISKRRAFDKDYFVVVLCVVLLLSSSSEVFKF
jgi:hypothetical protein